MSQNPLSALSDLLRTLVLLFVVAVVGTSIWLAMRPVDMNEAARGFPEHATAADAGVAEVTYEPALSHVAPSAPPVIGGRIAGIYTKREGECADNFNAVDGLCVHDAVHGDARSEACRDAFRRGVAPPSVAVVDHSVRWPTAISYERRSDVPPPRSQGPGERRMQPSETRRASTSGHSSAELRRLESERRARERESAALRERRRREAERAASTARYQRDERWRRIQVSR